MSTSARRINWSNAITVFSAVILIGTEVYIAAFAGGWALAELLGIGQYGVYAFQAALMVGATYALWKFMQAATRVEPLLVEK